MTAQLLALIGVVVVVVVAAGVVVVVVLTGRTDSGTIQLVTTVLGFAGTIIVVLLGIAGITNRVDAVHSSINGRMSELLSTSNAAAFKAGQVAGPESAPGVTVAPPPQPPGA